MTTWNAQIFFNDSWRNVSINTDKNASYFDAAAMIAAQYRVSENDIMQLEPATRNLSGGSVVHSGKFLIWPLKGKSIIMGTGIVLLSIVWSILKFVGNVVLAAGRH
jgi:hypothetical protein